MVIKKGVNLTDNELAQIREAIFREFKVPFTKDGQEKERLFFLLENEGKILAMGALWEVKPVVYNNENFVIYGVLNVVSNIKGRGYGKQVMTSIRRYLTSHNHTGLGFCMPRNKGFYEKCGFGIESESTKRFVYTKGAEKITNQDGQIIFYQESSDNFMQKVLSNPDKEVSIPTANLW